MTQREDHERGCQGREYTCTCGYDDERDAEIDRLRAEVDKWIVKWADADASVTKLEAERDDLRLQLVVAKTDAEVSADLLAVSHEVAEKAEAERYALAMAICGGEDAPGYLDSVSVEAIVGVHKHNCQWQIGRAEKAEAELAKANDDARITNELLTAAVEDYNCSLAELAQARKALSPFANMMPDDFEPKDALQKKLKEWCSQARAALITDTVRTEGEQK